MIEGDSNHYRIVMESLTELRDVDEQTFDSVSCLSERLKNLKMLEGAFSQVEFSPAVKELIAHHDTVAVA